MKETIPKEEIRDYSSIKRIQSIDLVKGLAIILIILCHTSGHWFDSDWIFLHGILYMWLDVFGPSLFIFLSALSVVFSLTKKKDKLPQSVIRNRIISRGLLIMLVGSFYTLASNMVYLPGLTFPFNMWGWNILVFIGASQIFSYYALKISQPGRIFIGFIILMFSPQLNIILTELILVEQGIDPTIWWVQMGVDSTTTVPPLITNNADINSFASFIYFILYSPTPQAPPFPWISICFISSIWGEWLAEAMQKSTVKAYKNFLKRIMKWGGFFVLIGIFFGYELMNVESARVEYIDITLWTIANQQPITYFPGMFRFLIHGQPSNTIYLMGMALLILAIFFYLLDIKRSSNDFFIMLIYYGKTSLSLFLIHYLCYFLFPASLNIIWAVFIIIGYVALLGFTMYLWIEFGDGKGSPEWIIIQMGRIGTRVEDKSKEVIEKYKIEHEKNPNE